MVIVHVFVHVKPDAIKAFKTASVTNAKCSLQEPGIARFDLVQERDKPERFVLIEVYRSEADILRHKETEHYKTWRNTVENMMAEPRHSIKFTNVFPDDDGWDGSDAV